MDCAFCSQWNPDDASRCCFCDNPTGADEDNTVKARPAYEGKKLNIPKALPSSFDLPRATGRRPPQLKIKLTENQTIAVGAGLLLLILLALSRC